MHGAALQRPRKAKKQKVSHVPPAPFTVAGAGLGAVSETFWGSWRVSGCPLVLLWGLFDSLGVLASPWGSLRVPWGSWGSLWNLWGSLGGSLGFLGVPWTSLGVLGSRGGPLQGPLGSLEGPLGVPWGPLGIPWGPLGVSWGVLLGARMDFSWFWNRFWGQLGIQNRCLGYIVFYNFQTS